MSYLTLNPTANLFTDMPKRTQRSNNTNNINIALSIDQCAILHADTCRNSKIIDPHRFICGRIL